MQSLALSWLSSGMIVQLEAKILLSGLQDEERKALFPIKQKGNLPPTHGPVFLATATVWDKLKRTAEHDVDIASDSFKVAERHVGKQALDSSAIRHWVFVPSYNRYGDENPRQMRIDWADAVSQETAYVRVVVVRSDEQQVAVRCFFMYATSCRSRLHQSSHITSAACLMQNSVVCCNVVMYTMR